MFKRILRMKARAAAGLAVLAWSALCAPAQADWINLTGAESAPNVAEITVLDDRVRVELEIFVGDITIFADLIPGHWYKGDRTPKDSDEIRLRRFAETGLRVAADGTALPMRLVAIERRLRKERYAPFAGMINPATRRKVPGPPADKRVVHATLDYPFAEKPKSVTLRPPVDADGQTRATIGFIAYHKVVPVIDFRYLAKQATLNLDWQDPWYSAFDNPNLKRHHKDALMSFLYIEPYEVRHELLVRVNDLKSMIDFKLRDPLFIDADEAAAVKRQVADFLTTRNPVRIDSAPAKPALDRIDFVTASLQGISIVDNPARMETAAAMLGVIFAFATPGIPKEVTVDWQLFSDRVQKVPTIATDPAGPLAGFVTPEDSRHIWTNYLKNYRLPQVVETRAAPPAARADFLIISGILVVLALPAFLFSRRPGLPVARQTLTYLSICLCVGGLGLAAWEMIRGTGRLGPAIPVTAEAQKPVVVSLLRNIYRAFDFKEEGQVYDRLAASAVGDLLTDIYLQSRQSLAIRRAGGAQARVEEVEVLELKPVASENPDGFSVDAQWTAAGKVGHWGHIHRRKNLYSARLDIGAIEGSWKITGLDIRDERRIDLNQPPGTAGIKP